MIIIIIITVIIIIYYQTSGNFPTENITWSTNFCSKHEEYIIQNKLIKIET